MDRISKILAGHFVALGLILGLLAAGQSAQYPWYFLHITDPHCHVKDGYQDHPLESPSLRQWQCLLEQIAEFDPPPRFVLCTGDMVNVGVGDAGERNFEAFLSTLSGDVGAQEYFVDEEMSIPLYFCPGNHEAKKNDIQSGTFDNYYRLVKSESYYSISGDDYVIFSLNSGKDEFNDAHWLLPEGDGLYEEDVESFLEDLAAVSDTVRKESVRKDSVDKGSVPDDVVHNGSVGKDLVNKDFVSKNSIFEHYASEDSLCKIVMVHHPYVNPEADFIGSSWNAWVDGAFLHHRNEFIAACDEYGVNVVLSGHYDLGVRYRHDGILGRQGQAWEGGDGTIFVMTNGIQLFNAYRRVTVIAPGQLEVGAVEQFRSPAAGEVPLSLRLQQNYPNPFNSRTTIEFGIPYASNVRLDVFNVLGQGVITLIDQPLDAGRHTVSWEGRDAAGNDVASGVYFCRLTAGDVRETKKMFLLR